MAWGGSKVFRLTLSEMMDNTQAWDLGADTFKAALYNNTTTPDNDVTTAALHSYNGAASQWVVANEVTGTGWAAGGVTMTSTILAPPSGAPVADRVFFDSADTPSSAGATISGAFGCLVYDTATLGTANRGLSYHDFGGTQSVTAGLFTIVWHANGVVNCTL